jgi:hypothetical protein
MKILKFAVALSVIMAMSVTTFGQDLESNLESLAKDNAKGYVGPLVTSVGIGLNSGLYRTAKVHKILGFDIAINAAGIMIPAEGKTYGFTATGLGSQSITLNSQNYSIDLDEALSQIEAPTIFGSSDGADVQPVVDNVAEQVATASGLTADQVKTQFGTELENFANSLNVIPPGFEQDYAFVPSAQASIGLPMRTEVTVRYLPAYTLNDDLGELSLFGIGGRISIDQFIPVPFFPIDIAAGLFYQDMELGPVSVNSSILHAEVGKTLPFITVYGGVAYEMSNLSAEYTLEGTSNTINLDVPGENQFRGTVGLRLKFLVLTVNADYNIGTYNSVTAGAGITFR